MRSERLTGKLQNWARPLVRQYNLPVIAIAGKNCPGKWRRFGQVMALTAARFPVKLSSSKPRGSRSPEGFRLSPSSLRRRRGPLTLGRMYPVPLIKMTVGPRGKWASDSRSGRVRWACGV